MKVWDRATLIASYIILVSLVVWSVAWLNNETDEVQQQRCDLLLIELALIERKADVTEAEFAIIEKLRADACG